MTPCPIVIWLTEEEIPAASPEKLTEFLTVAKALRGAPFPAAQQGRRTWLEVLGFPRRAGRRDHGRAARHGSESALHGAALEFAATWRHLLASLPDSYACYMSCTEAEVAADLFRAAGYDGAAAEIIAAHARYDEPGDLHYTAPELPATPMGDREALAALASLWTDSGWRRLEASREDGPGYGGWCSPAQGPWAWTQDLAAWDGVLGADVSYDQGVIDRLTALLDASGWRRLQAFGEPGGQPCGRCERADGSIVSLADVLEDAVRVPAVTVPRYAAPRVTATPVTEVISQVPGPDWCMDSPGHYQQVLLDTRTGKLSFFESALHLEPRPLDKDAWNRWHPGTLFTGTGPHEWYKPVPGLLSWIIDSGVPTWAYLDAAAASTLLSEIAPYAQALLDWLFDTGELDWSARAVKAGRDIAGLCSRRRAADGRAEGLADYGDIIGRFPYLADEDILMLAPGEMDSRCESITRFLGINEHWHPEVTEAFGAPWPGYEDEGSLHVDALGVRAWYRATAGVVPGDAMPSATPMSDEEVQTALGALWADSGWERLEISLQDPARRDAARYGGYCVRDRAGERYLHAETADLLAGNGTFARGLTYDRDVIDRLAALLDASGWQRLEAVATVPGRVEQGCGGWCERADGSGFSWNSGDLREAGDNAPRPAVKDPWM
jgi:hypothetical protein